MAFGLAELSFPLHTKDFLSPTNVVGAVLKGIRKALQ
jgi:hypothetical protein